MESEILRKLVFEALKANPKTQFVNLFCDVGRTAAHQGIVKSNERAHDGRENLEKGDLGRLREICWNLITQGIITLGNDADPNVSWPYFEVTEYGHKCIKEDRIFPYDPDGYIKNLLEEVPKLDDTIRLYLTESLQTFRRGNHLASTVMLGVASEKAFLLLVESLINYLSIQSTKEKLSNSMKKSRSIKALFDDFLKTLEGIRGDIPSEVRGDLDVQLAGVFNLIRNYRNDAGHPTGRQISREQAYANLQVFVSYCKRVYDLIEFFENSHKP